MSLRVVMVLQLSTQIVCAYFVEPSVNQVQAISFSIDYWQHSCHTPLGHNSKWDKGFASNLRSTLFFIPLEACQRFQIASLSATTTPSTIFFFFPAGSYDPSSTTGSPFTNTSPVLNYTQKQKFFLVPCNQWGWSCLQNPQWPTKCSVSVLVAGWARCNNLSNTCEGVPLHDPHNWSPRNFTKLNGPWNLLNLFLIYYYANIHK